MIYDNSLIIYENTITIYDESMIYIKDDNIPFRLTNEAKPNNKKTKRKRLNLKLW